MFLLFKDIVLFKLGVKNLDLKIRETAKLHPVRHTSGY